MRIAVCLSGAVRTGIIASKTHFNFLKNHLENTDFFIHTWDHETMSAYGLNGRISRFEKFPYPISHHKVDKVQKIYNPKKLVWAKYHETLTQWPELLKEKFGDNTTCTDTNPMFINTVLCDELRREYEKENNFEYDLVIKLRFDCVFAQDHYIDEEIEHMQSNGLTNTLYLSDDCNKLNIQERCLRTEELFWIADSKTMSKACDFTYARATNSRYCQLDWQCEITRYLQDIGIQAKQLKRNEVYIYRFYHAEEGVDPYDRTEIKKGDYLPP